MMTMRAVCVAVLLLACGVGTSAADTADEALTLRNDTLELTIHPRWGGRASSFRVRDGGYEFVRRWAEPVEQGREAGTRTGGVFAGFMSGSYRSAQLHEPYAVVERSEQSVTLRYVNEHMLLSGLEETRTIRLAPEGGTVTMAVRVRNTSDEVRQVYYRFQDWIGPGMKRGRDSVYVVPTEATRPTVFDLPARSTRLDNYYYTPAQPWYGLVDLVSDVGLQVRVEGTPVAMVFFWAGDGSDNRTAEIFMPPQVLEPGEAWSFTMHYSVFSPSESGSSQSEDPGAQVPPWLSRASLEARLANLDDDAMVALTPYQARMRVPFDEAALTVEPMHIGDPKLPQRSVSASGLITLDAIALEAARGQTATFAWRTFADANVKGVTVRFSDLRSDQHTIAAGAFEPRFVSMPDGFLVRDWALASETPQQIGGINNALEGADALTAFPVGPDQSVPIFAYLRVPDDAPPGRYTGQVTLAADGQPQTSFDVSLQVYPFALEQPRDKHYGSFFRYFLKQSADDDRQPAVSRETYRRVLEQLDEVGYDSLVIYSGNQEDVHWVLDQCVELGWDSGTFVLIGAAQLSAEQLQARYGSYDMTLLGWGVDEPTRYSQIAQTVTRYQQILDRGFTPVFTPNVPLGLIILENLNRIVPIMALSGTGPYAFDVTRRYREAGRLAYWYNTDMSRPTLEKRLVRGIYLWKEPVNGILDWGEDAQAQSISVHKSAGFVGTEPVPTLGRENVRQALLDLHYLHTLEQRLATTPNEAAAAEARQLLSWIRTRFDDNWHDVARSLPGPAYLDQLRHSVAVQIEALGATAEE